MLPVVAMPESPEQTRRLSSSLQVSIARVAQMRMPSPPLAYEEPAVPFFETPLFDSARKAVTFAVTREGNPARPFQSRITDKGSIDAKGTGLSGTDSAAQAGIIMSLIRRTGPLSTAVLIASCAPSSIPCQCKRSCCGGKRLFNPWHESVGQLVDVAALVTRAGYPLRLAIIVKLYSRRLTLAEIAEQLALDVKTVSTHHKTIDRWLHGAPPGKNGEPAVCGIESEAWQDAESTLRNYGIVG